MRALITGATGLVGQELCLRLKDAVVLSRSPEQARQRLPKAELYAWDPEAELPCAAALAGIDVVFHLAGEPVGGGRWTDARKRRIRESRILGTRNLVAGLAREAQRPRLLVSASAIGYYGERGDQPLDEGSAPGRGFLAELCTEWEQEARAAERHGVRVVCVRLGLVLARTGGALARMLTPFRMGLGGPIGGGDQWMSWIHLADVVGILLHASHYDELQGAINAVAPLPVRNVDFTRALAARVHRPAFIPLPRALLRVALGEMSELLTSSQRVFPRAALRTGYSFQYPELGQALAAVT